MCERCSELEVANTLYLQEVKRLTALLRANGALPTEHGGDGGGGSDRPSLKRPQSAFGRSSLDQSKLSMQNVYEVRVFCSLPLQDASVCQPLRHNFTVWA